MPKHIEKFSGIALITAALGWAVLTPTIMAQTNSPLGSPRSGIPASWIGIWAGATKNPPPGYKVENPLAQGELDKVIEDHLQPWALAEEEATEWDLDDTGQLCKLNGIFRPGSVGTGGFTLLQAPGKVIILNSVDEMGPRRIFFNSPHPPNLTPSWNGDSRAHWEGEVLVIDTIGFNDRSWLMSNREPHSEELHVVEFLRPILDGSYVQLRVIVDDRRAFKSPYTYTRFMKKMPPETEAVQANCNQSDGPSLWGRRHDELVAAHEAALAEYIRQVTAKDK